MRDTSRSYSDPFRPRPVAWFNRLGSAIPQSDQLLGNLGVDNLIKAAQRRTGLNDLGDPSLALRLSRLVDSLEREARLHPLGRVMARQNLLRILVNRLRIQQAFRENPDILEQQLQPPIFVVGLQRTGTTMLHRLLAANRGLRHLASWEAINPAPFPEPASWRKALPSFGPQGQDPRLGMAQLAQRAVAYMAPDFFAIHPIQADAPEEDCLLFDFSFHSTVPEATWRVPSFSDFLEHEDHLPAYREYQKLLQYLSWQSGSGRPWVQKTPQHLEHLPQLLSVFPEARIIWTHRDPNKTVASFCSMMAHAWGVFSDQVDPHDVARHWANKAQRMVESAMQARDQLGDEHFLDVAYSDLVAEPLEQMERIYGFLGMTLDGENKQAMHSWRRKNPQHKHGRHSYSLDDFGLDPGQVDAMFGAYRDRYKIHPEG